jgi:hypothetical protein
MRDNQRVSDYLVHFSGSVAPGENWHLGIGFMKVYLLGLRMNLARAKSLGPYRF